jgi:hypothetical protein
MTKLALTFYSVLRMPIADILRCAGAAEEAGFGFISVAESFYCDGAALAAAIACNTGTIRLGTSVFPIYTRTPFQLAMAIATLDEFWIGRMGYCETLQRTAPGGHRGGAGCADHPGLQRPLCRNREKASVSAGH